MVTHSNYSKNKAFKAQNIKQQFIKKKTKQRKATIYLGNRNKLKKKNTKKRKHSKKGNVYKGSLKSKKKTPININKYNRDLTKVKLKELDGGGIFSKCINVSIDNNKKKYDRLDSKLNKFLEPFSNTMNMMKTSYLKVLKKQYYNELIYKRRLFNQKKKRDEVKGDGDTAVFDQLIEDLEANLHEIANIIDIKLDESKLKMAEFNKKKKKYDRASKNYRQFVDKLMYGSKKISLEIDKKSFSYKINKIIDIKQTAEVTSEGSDEKKKYNKCKKKYDKAIEIYTDMKARIGANLFKAGTLNNDILFINAFITKSGKDHERNILKFRNEWEKETDNFYFALIKLVPEQSVESITTTDTNRTVKGLDYKKDVEEIESQIINIYDTFNQVNESVLQINVVRILEFVKNFMSGIKNTQGSIVKDLRLLKEEFLNLKGASVLKSMSNHIVRAHLQNTKLLICIKYYFDNIDSEEAIKLFTTTNISKYSDFNKRIGLSQGLGISTVEQNVFQQPVIKAPASGPILSNITTPASVGNISYMKGGGIVDDILKQHKKFEINKETLDNLIETTKIEADKDQADSSSLLDSIQKEIYKQASITSKTPINKDDLKAYEKSYEDMLKLRKTYYLKLLYFLILSEKIKEKTTLAKFKTEKEEAIMNFKKSSLYITYSGIFDDKEIIDDIFDLDLFKSLEEKKDTKAKLNIIRKKMLNDKYDTLDGDNINKAETYFRNMLKAD